MFSLQCDYISISTWKKKTDLLVLNPLLGGPFVFLSETQTQLGKLVQSELALRKRATYLAKQCVPRGKLHIERSTRPGRKSKK